MEKEELERYLAEGLSLEQIGERVGRHPSTIGYHLKKHGLKAVHHEKYAGRGGLSEVLLREIVANGMTWSEIAGAVERSKSTVRYWLDKYGLWPLPATGRRAEALRAREQGSRYAELECSRHGRMRFILENRGYHRCVKCRAERVSAWRRRAKVRLVEAAGGSCKLCGYGDFRGALQFHHLDPTEKEFSISREGVTRSFAELQAEAAKCVLLCANCHAEVEGGYRTLGDSPEDLAA